MVRVWEDVRRRDKDEDRPLHQEDRARRGGDAGGHPLSDSPAYRAGVLQQPVLPAQVGHSGLVRGKTAFGNSVALIVPSRTFAFFV